MKIKKAHLAYIQGEISKVLANNPAIVSDYENGLFPRSNKVKDLQKRFCFDLHYAAGLVKFTCDELYSYMDDSHLYTALKAVCPKVTRAY